MTQTTIDYVLSALIILVPIITTIHRIFWGKYSKWWLVIAWAPIASVVFLFIVALMALGNMH